MLILASNNSTSRDRRRSKMLLGVAGLGVGSGFTAQGLEARVSRAQRLRPSGSASGIPKP